MLGLFEALDEINKSIFQHNKVESGNRDPQNPLSPPLKHSPKINPENDFSVFFFTIFNLCSGGERRDCVREKNEPKKVVDEQKSEQEQIKQENLTNISESEKSYEVHTQSRYLTRVILRDEDFEYSENNKQLFRIKPVSDNNQEPMTVIIINEQKRSQILNKSTRVI